MSFIVHLVVQNKGHPGEMARAQPEPKHITGSGTGGHHLFL